jgi:hypothetical protein
MMVKEKQWWLKKKCQEVGKEGGAWGVFDWTVFPSESETYHCVIIEAPS